MGDVVIRDILETYGLLPANVSKTEYAIIPTDAAYIDYSNEVAQKMRTQGKNVVVDYTERKIGDKIKTADRMKIPNVIVIGEEEMKSGVYKIKNLATGEIS
jgi:histidyl-tRNA synthetase